MIVFFGICMVGYGFCLIWFLFDMVFVGIGFVGRGFCWKRFLGLRLMLCFE